MFAINSSFSNNAGFIEKPVTKKRLPSTSKSTRGNKNSGAINGLTGKSSSAKIFTRSNPKTRSQKSLANSKLHDPSERDLHSTSEHKPEYRRDSGQRKAVDHHNQRGDYAGERRTNQMREALDLWNNWLSDSSWYQLDRWLKHTLGKNRKYGKRDRLFYGDVLFNGARFGYWAAAVINCQGALLGSDDPAISTIALERYAHHHQNATELKELLEQLGQGEYGADFLALCQWRATPQAPLPTDLRQYQAPIDAIRQCVESNLICALIWHGIPASHTSYITEFGKISTDSSSTARFLAAQDTRPPLWLRLNHADKKHAVIGELAEFYRFDIDGYAIAIEGDHGVFGLECYKNGWVEIQDWASQQLALKVAATPGQKVWDACAGGGGKTLAIAAPLNNKGAVWATDIREHKLLEVKRRAKQAEFYNIRTAPWKGDQPFEPPKEIARDGGFDWVLVDGPCSSSGTWRRNPDAKLRNAGEDLTKLTNLQLQLLSNASLSVKAGGKLVYGTCSFYELENMGVVERFLNSHQGWTLESAELLGCPQNNSDTLFAAVLSRTPSAQMAHH
jgi:16S rRNA (cytosine967-C5)-methyltransferase